MAIIYTVSTQRKLDEEKTNGWQSKFLTWWKGYKYLCQYPEQKVGHYRHTQKKIRNKCRQVKRFNEKWAEIERICNTNTSDMYKK